MMPHAVNMYRDDLAAAVERASWLEHDLEAARGESVDLKAQLTQAKQRIAYLQNGGKVDGLSFEKDHSTMVMVLGILSMLIGVTGPIAWGLGEWQLGRLRAGRISPHAYHGLIAGRVCGVIGTLFLLLVGGLVVVSN